MATEKIERKVNKDIKEAVNLKLSAAHVGNRGNAGRRVPGVEADHDRVAKKATA